MPLVLLAIIFLEFILIGLNGGGDPGWSALELLGYFVVPLGTASALPWAIRKRRRMLVERKRRARPELLGDSPLSLPDCLDHLQPALADLARSTRALRCDLEDVVGDARSWEEPRAPRVWSKVLGTWFEPDTDGPNYVTRELWEWARDVEMLPASARAQLAELGLSEDPIRTQLSSDGDFYERLQHCLRQLQLFDRGFRIQGHDPFRGPSPRPTRLPASTARGEPTKPRDASAAIDLDLAFRAIEPRLRKTLAALGVPEYDLDDAVQEVFTVAHRRREDFDGRAPLEHWLFGIARGVARNIVRRLDRRPLPLVSEPVADAPTPADFTLQNEQLAQAMVAIEGLCPEQREVFLRVDVEGHRVIDLANSGTTKLSTLHSRLRLARQAVRRVLARERS
jgi:RNA polymerase sigma-70 factor, ECF subfamily